MKEIHKALNDLGKRITTDSRQKSERVNKSYAALVSKLKAKSDISKEGLMLTDFSQFNPSLYTKRLIGAPMVMIGNLLSKRRKQLNFPFFLPFSNQRGIAFILNEKNEDEINRVIELLVFRLLLSFPRDLINIHLVDPLLAKSFRSVASLEDSNLLINLYTRPEEIDPLLEDLRDNILKANQTYLKDYRSITELNMSPNRKGLKPYHFLFISNFPKGFDSISGKKLLNLIKDGNAASAGIYCFFTVDKKVKWPYDIDFQFFANDLTIIQGENRTGYRFSGINEISFDHKEYKLVLQDQFPPNMQAITDFLSEVKPSIVTFKNELTQLLNSNKLWRENATKGVKIPIGKISNGELHFFELSSNTNDYFSLIGGLPGKGKTILLHNIITNGAFFYSPFEIEYYLVDCKNGTSFKPYDQLPHAKILSISNDREYALSILDNLIEKEAKRRADLFKANNCADFEDFREKVEEKLPRIIMIIDEFQVLLEKGDIMSVKIEALLEKTISLGRSYGFNLILCTQGLGKITFNPANISRRYAFNLSEYESERIIRNNEAAKLNLPGNVLMNNTQNGEKTNNVNIQVAYLNDKEDVQIYAQNLNNIFKKKYPRSNLKRYISDGSGRSVINSNPELVGLLTGRAQVNDRFCDIYIGEPCFVREKHSYFRIRKQSKSNVIVSGNDPNTALSIFTLCLYQLVQVSNTNSKFYLFDFFSIDSPYRDILGEMSSISPNVKSKRREELLTHIEDMSQELKRRIHDEKEGKKVDGRIVQCFLSFQNCEDLKKEGYDDIPEKLELETIIKKGPAYGIHTIIHTIAINELQDIFDQIEYGLKNSFENRIALYGESSENFISKGSRVRSDEKGKVVLQSIDEATSFGADLCKVYNRLHVPPNLPSSHPAQILHTTLKKIYSK